MKYFVLKGEYYSWSLPFVPNDSAEISAAAYKAYLFTLPKPVPDPDFKALWAAAGTAADKFTVLAQKLNLN